METELCRLAVKYRSDKGPRFRKHSYTQYYFNLFNNKRDKIKKVLEFGIGSNAASLYMWRDFFPYAQIYGADNLSERLINKEHITSFFCDQSKKEDILNLYKNIGQDIDIVIDDASHIPNDQLSTCLTLMPLLKKDCVYIIEDVADPGIVNDLKKEFDVTMPVLQPKINRYDNRLIVVRHKKKASKNKAITFFAKDPVRIGSDRHLGRVSSIIRAHQIAEAIDAKLNPASGYKKDTLIYVKPPYKVGDKFNFEGKKTYFDLVDEYKAYKDLLLRHPEVGIISISDWNNKILKRIFPKNKIVNIPQHNCNFERYKKNNQNITTIGMIGISKAFDYLPKGIDEQLSNRGLKFIKFTEFSTREDIVNFYMGIDLQIVWRPYLDYNKEILANPLKIVNASSFGVPTLALDEPAFEELKGCYLPVNSLEDLLTKLDKLMIDPEKYQKLQKTCLETAEKYHIDKISKLYEKLA